jgi:GNAT superfamily N-acetyltransferase
VARASDESVAQLEIRVAAAHDLPHLMPLVDRAIGELQQRFLDAAQIESSRAIMGIDSQLIADETYYVVETGGEIAGCGGWSRRATMYGGDATTGRDDALLDPAKDPARIRAMYTNPDHVRRGVGRLILATCEAAAASEGFRSMELVATLAGRPLYEAAGYVAFEELSDSTGGAPVPVVRMRKHL